MSPTLTFNKLPQCEGCRFYSHNLHLRCTIHPTGQVGGSCPDFQADPRVCPTESEFLALDGVTGEEFQTVPIDDNPFEDGMQWEPEGASYYAGELIIDAVQRFNREQKLEQLNWHPMFTGRCPECESAFTASAAPVHWDCSHCGWKDDNT